MAPSINFYNIMLARRTCHTALGPGTLGPSQTHAQVRTNTGGPGSGTTGVTAPFCDSPASLLLCPRGRPCQGRCTQLCGFLLRELSSSLQG